MATMPHDRLPFRDVSAWPAGFEINQQEEQPQVIEQWIEQVTVFSSQYGTENGGDDAWCARQVVGPPRVPQYGDNILAWAPRNTNTREWIELRIARPCKVQQVRIHESFTCGAFARLQLFDGERFVTAVEQPARCGRYPHQMRVEVVDVPPERQITTNRLRLELDQQGGNNWYEIDAVQVVGTAGLLWRRLISPLPKRQEVLARHISLLMNDLSTADCTLVVVDTNEGACNTARIPVHRCILAARCPLFRAMLDNEELPAGGEKVLQGISPALVQHIVEWMYTANLADLPKKDCVALATAADYFQLDDLLDYCVAVFTGLLAVENAALLFAHFDKVCIEPLKEAALDYCGKNFQAVSQTPAFQNLSQQQLLSVIEHYRQTTEVTEAET